MSDQPVFTDASDGWVFGQVGGLFRTIDGGASWTSVALPRAQYLDVGSPVFADPRHGTLVAQEFPATGAVVLSTADGGATWTRRPIAWPGLGDVGEVQMFDARHGLVLMASRLTPVGPTFDQTSDGGRTWRPLVLPRPGAVPAVDVAGGQLWAGPPIRMLGSATAVTWQAYEDAVGRRPGLGRVLRDIRRRAHVAPGRPDRAGRHGGRDVDPALDRDLADRAESRDHRRRNDLDRQPLHTVWRCHYPCAGSSFRPMTATGWAGVGQSTIMCAGPDGCGPDGLEATSDGGQTWRSLAP